ncbi:helix-turn-helix transcriptional regulator [Halocella sp. SP3-1]|uniref:helix-turn-helix domain-containing protein n=1 Tax=Halocella sp. SP3-1 TaxID=2382161 RepID=UPI000F74DCB2|nr:helix-turn-helix transcriptional regulator [Halocella sp. SP3-1]AZO94559.1 XRE family transcriptional regulator [Halocella sp. SP3-1]
MKKITVFPEALRKARKEKFTNASDIALKVGCSEKTYRQYEKDNAPLPPAEIVLTICNVLDNKSLFVSYLYQLFSEQNYSPFELKWFFPLMDDFHDLRREVLTTIKEIRDVVNLEHTIIDISLDGEIIEQEIENTSNYLKEVNDLIDALMQLKTHLEKEIAVHQSNS